MENCRTPLLPLKYCISDKLVINRKTINIQVSLVGSHISNCSNITVFLNSLSYVLLSIQLVEEREKPELLAESATRRKRVATESGKTEQQVYSPNVSGLRMLLQYTLFSLPTTNFTVHVRA